MSSGRSDPTALFEVFWMLFFKLAGGLAGRGSSRSPGKWSRTACPIGLRGHVHIGEAHASGVCGLLLVKACLNGWL